MLGTKGLTTQPEYHALLGPVCAGPAVDGVCAENLETRDKMTAVICCLPGSVIVGTGIVKTLGGSYT